MPLGEILRLSIQLGLERARAEEWRCLRTQTTQHLSNVFEREKTTVTTVVKLDAQLTKAKVAREEGKRKSRANDTST